MTTVLKIINKGATKAKIKGIGRALTAGEVGDALEDLNDIIKEWSAKGILKGVVPIHDVNLDLKEPEYATAALKYELAMRMIAEYGYDGDISVIATAANKAKDTMLMSKPQEEIVYPDTLPRGSGNYDAVENDFFPLNIKDNF